MKEERFTKRKERKKKENQDIAEVVAQTIKWLKIIKMMISNQSRGNSLWYKKGYGVT